MFDTETMAELCVKQGLYDQAIDIYRRMATEVDDPAARRRYEERIVALEHQPDLAPLSTPGLRVARSGDEVRIEWRLPSDTSAPTLQVLLLRRTASGIEPETRTLPLAGPHGRTALHVAGLHSVRAAAGRLAGELFVPLIRLAPVSSSSSSSEPSQGLRPSPRRGSDVI
jgi:hypothetical protein